jgi:hypothetical protein
VTGRSGERPWAPVAARWLRACERPGTRTITVPDWVTGTAAIPCANLRR